MSPRTFVTFAGDPELEAFVRRIAREEIASLSGLVLRRLQENPDEDAGIARRIASAFGEALHDFTTDAEPGT